MSDKLYELAKEKSMTLDEIAETWVQMDEYITNVNEFISFVVSKSEHFPYYQLIISAMEDFGVM